MSNHVGLAMLMVRVLLPVASFELTILHVNDVHSRIDEDTPYGVPKVGGWARMAAYVRNRTSELEAENKHVIFLDAGDEFTGQVWNTYYRGKFVVQLMNALMPTAFVTGNHETYKGESDLAAFIDTANFPILSANMAISSTADARIKAKESKINSPLVIEKDGTKIGIVGVTTVESNNAPTLTGKISFTDPRAALESKIAELRSSGVNIVVALTHVGYTIDKTLAGISGIDVIVGGHSHTTLGGNTAYGTSMGNYPTMVGSVPIAQADCHTHQVGELTLTFDAAGNVTSAVGTLKVLTEDLPEDPAISAMIEAKRPELAAYSNSVAGQATEDIDGERAQCRNVTCAYGILLCDAIRTSGRGQGFGTQIVLYNGGGIRASVKAGNVTVGELLEVHPFGNAMSFFHLNGSDVKEVLTYMLDLHGAPDQGTHGGWMQMAGVRFQATWKSGTSSWTLGSTQVEASGPGGGWTDLEDNVAYSVASNEFNRFGGDGYTMLKDKAAPVLDFGIKTITLMIEYFGSNSPVSSPTVDDRHCLTSSCTWKPSSTTVSMAAGLPSPLIAYFAAFTTASLSLWMLLVE